MALEKVIYHLCSHLKPSHHPYGHMTTIWGLGNQLAFAIGFSILFWLWPQCATIFADFQKKNTTHWGTEFGNRIGNYMICLMTVVILLMTTIDIVLILGPTWLTATRLMMQIQYWENLPASPCLAENFPLNINKQVPQKENTVHHVFLYVEAVPSLHPFPHHPKFWTYDQSSKRHLSITASPPTGHVIAI